ncbi:unnamed protein product, partial [Rotaria sp. Silwood1]
IGICGIGGAIHGIGICGIGICGIDGAIHGFIPPNEGPPAKEAPPNEAPPA